MKLAIQLTQEQHETYNHYPTVVQKKALEQLQWIMRRDTIKDPGLLLLSLCRKQINPSQSSPNPLHQALDDNAGIILGDEAAAYQSSKQPSDKKRQLSQEELAAKYGAPGNHVPDNEYFNWLVSPLGWKYISRYGYDNKSGIRPDFSRTASAVYRHYFLKARHERDMKDLEQGLTVLGPVRTYPTLPNSKV